jgi:hypothetical protein
MNYASDLRAEPPAVYTLVCHGFQNVLGYNAVKDVR